MNAESHMLKMIGISGMILSGVVSALISVDAIFSDRPWPGVHGAVALSSLALSIGVYYRNRHAE